MSIDRQLSMSPSKREVMKFIEKDMAHFVDSYLVNIDENWQPADLLPMSQSQSFTSDIMELQRECKELPYDYLVVLVGDIITEEALPSYESWLMDIEGVEKSDQMGWSQWIRQWTAEENKHGDLLNKYVYLSGRINMRQMEISTQHLLSDGVDNGASKDPYKNFVYTSFQEMATNISHRRTATLAKKFGNGQLSKICGIIAGDEMRHAKAYKNFISRIFEVDPSEMMLAFDYMMRKKIVMPAQFLRQQGEKIGTAFSYFSDAAQRLGVYTSSDYTDIMESLITEWKIADITGLNDAAEKARDYLMGLPARYRKISDRVGIKAPLEYQFNWIH